jgi:DNA-binding GntR family transcriptional regulator
VAAPLTEAAIAKMREMIATRELEPGARLPPESWFRRAVANRLASPLDADAASGQRVQSDRSRA